MRILINLKHNFFKIRSFFLKLKILLFARNVYFGKNIQIIGARKFYIGKNSTIGDSFWLNINNSGPLDSKKVVYIGSNSNIGRHNFFTVGNNLSIGDYFFSSCYCSIIGATHEISNPFKPYIISEVIDLGAGIKIGPNVFMGSHSMISGSLNIGFGSIIASGSVVVDDVPPLSVVAGNPARVIKRFCLSSRKWVSSDSFSEENIISEQEYMNLLKTDYKFIMKAKHAASVREGWT